MYILTDMYKYHFKFCFITNNSVNAKFLVRYIGLKLKRKFPLRTKLIANDVLYSGSEVRQSVHRHLKSSTR